MGICLLAAVLSFSLYSAGMVAAALVFLYHQGDAVSGLINRIRYVAALVPPKRRGIEPVERFPA
jgi:hypothetical protein